MTYHWLFQLHSFAIRSHKILLGPNAGQEQAIGPTLPNLLPSPRVFKKEWPRLGS